MKAIDDLLFEDIGTETFSCSTDAKVYPIKIYWDLPPIIRNNIDSHTGCHLTDVIADHDAEELRIGILGFLAE